MISVVYLNSTAPTVGPWRTTLKLLPVGHYTTSWRAPQLEDNKPEVVPYSSETYDVNAR